MPAFATDRRHRRAAVDALEIDRQLFAPWRDQIVDRIAARIAKRQPLRRVALQREVSHFVHRPPGGCDQPVERKLGSPLGRRGNRLQTRRGSELVVDHPQTGVTLIDAIEPTFDAHRARPTLIAPAHIKRAGLLARQKSPATGRITDGPVQVAVERCAPFGKLTERAGTTGHLTKGDLIGDLEQQGLQRVTAGPVEGHRAGGGIGMKSLEDLVDPLPAFALARLIDRLRRLAQPPAVLGEKAKRTVEQSLDRADRQAVGQPGEAWRWPLCGLR